ALLYNIASALQGLKRPHEAAEALRSFLRLQPNDPDRPKIDQRIATLEEEQRMIDTERAKKEAEAEAERRKNTPAPVLTLPPPEVRTVIVHDSNLSESDRRHRRKVLAVSLTIGGIVLVGGALALALALTQTSTSPYTMTELGPHPGTR
ncbi:MAG: hypothetical protein JWM53_4195, partial [bacterium]|nr:hypothetical protein [bacterium]